MVKGRASGLIKLRGIPPLPGEVTGGREPRALKLLRTMILLTALIHGAIIWLAARPQHFERW